MVVFSYASLLPAGLYGFLWWAGQNSTATISFLELLCLYGYSLTIYIPVSLLWLIQVSTATLSTGGGGGNFFGNLGEIFETIKSRRIENERRGNVEPI